VPFAKELVEDPGLVQRIPATLENGGLSWTADIVELGRDVAFVEIDRHLRSGSPIKLRFRRPRDWSVVEMQGVVERHLQHADEIPPARTEIPRIQVVFSEPLDEADPIAS